MEKPMNKAKINYSSKGCPASHYLFKCTQFWRPVTPESILLQNLYYSSLWADSWAFSWLWWDWQLTITEVIFGNITHKCKMIYQEAGVSHFGLTGWHFLHCALLKCCKISDSCQEFNFWISISYFIMKGSSPSLLFGLPVYSKYG